MKMKTILASLLGLMICVSAIAGGNAGKWQLKVSDGVSISHDKQMLIGGAAATYCLDGKKITTADYDKRKVKTSRVDDAFGKGKQIELTYSSKRLPTLTQTFRIYDKYVLVDASVAAGREISVNRIEPLVAHELSVFMSSGEQRKLFVPFDNDAWVRYYSACDTGDTLRSYEVTAGYNPQSRRGVVVGAINHDNWKNAIDLLHGSTELRAISGVADKLTRDSKAHGSLTGTTIKSATFMIGCFDDWREGMETYAKANATVSKPRQWDKAAPVGWNSWGALAFDVNHKNSCEVIDFIANDLQNHSFHNSEGIVYTGLDSGWNSFSDDELTDFCKRCVARNQVPCVYWTPFVDWGKNGETDVPYSNNLKYKDIWLYANGKPQELDGGYAIDPTHPAVRKMMEVIAEKFRGYGFKYVKMDFMTHGRLEADGWYDKSVHTGTQAYNFGMQLLDSIFHDMYLNLSISPIFPSQYAQSRRIACDAWNKIKDTEYTLNALSWGWWINGVYDYNDADHVVLRDAEEGENRCRVTSSAITGIFITGDDFSKTGKEDVKKRARLYLTNPDINAMANGKAFRPLEGDNDRSENTFTRRDDDTVYVACFNYGDKEANYAIAAERLGVNDYGQYDITELWSHDKVNDLKAFTVRARDVKVFRLKKK